MSSEQNNTVRHDGQNHSTENELEKYGVWVKSGPKDIVDQNNLSTDDTLDMEDLPDFSFIDGDQPAEDIFDTPQETDMPNLDDESDSEFLSSFDEETDDFTVQDTDEIDFSQSLPDDSGFSSDLELGEENIMVDLEEDPAVEDDPFAALTTDEDNADSDDFSLELTEENFDIPDFGETISIETEDEFAEIESKTDDEETPIMDTVIEESAEDSGDSEPFDDQNMVEPIQQILGSTPETAPSFDDMTEVTEFTDTAAETTPAYSDNSEEKRILQEIARELSGLRLEFAQLKQEIESLKTSTPEAASHHKVTEIAETVEVADTTETAEVTEAVEVADTTDEIFPKPEAKSSGGFFSDTDEDETISLSGDELINILATADFTEENGDENEISIPDTEEIVASDCGTETEPAEADTADISFSTETTDFSDISDISEPTETTDFADSEEPVAAETESRAMADDTDEFNADSIIDSLDSNMFSTESILQKIEFDDENLEEPVLEELVLPETDDFTENDEIIIQRPEDIMVDSSEAFFNDADETPLTEETLEAEETASPDANEPQADTATVIDDIDGFEEITAEETLPEMEEILDEVVSDEIGIDEIPVVEEPFDDLAQEILSEEIEPIEDPVEALFAQTESAPEEQPVDEIEESTLAESFTVLDADADDVAETEQLPNSVEFNEVMTEPETDDVAEANEEMPDEIVLANDDNLFADDIETAETQLDEVQPTAGETTESLTDEPLPESTEITDTLNDELLPEVVESTESLTDEVLPETAENTEASTEEMLPEIDENAGGLIDKMLPQAAEITDALSDEMQIDESETDDEQSDEPTETVFESEQWNELSLELGENIEKVPPVIEEPEENLAEDQPAIPVDLKHEIRSVLSYMDQLLESLPEEKIAEFAQSEHFDVYKKLFKEMGLSQ